MAGSSRNNGKPQIIEWFEKNKNSIKTIIDIGAGSGTYYKLVEENNIKLNANWTAVEAWAPYIEKFKLSDMYDTVINQDARKLNWNDLGKFDLAIAGDVLEHMTKNEAIQLVDDILKKCKTLLISIPIVHMPQDAVEGNPFEIHVKDDWSHDEVIDTWGSKIKEHYRKSSKTKVAVYWLSND